MANIIQGQKYTLSGSGITSSQTTIPLNSFNLPDGSAIVSGDLATTNYGTLEPGTSREEIISFTGITSTTLTGVTRGLKFVTPYTADASLKNAHAGNTIFVLTNNPQVYQSFVDKSTAQTIGGVKTFSSLPATTAGNPVADNDIARKAYVDSVVSGSFPSNRLVVAGTAGETIANGNLIYFDSVTTKEWMLADADTAAKVENVMLGIAQGAGTDGAAITDGILLYGTDDAQSGMTIGDIMYASDTAGAISSTPGTKEVTIGIAKTATTLYFYPRNDQQITEDQQDALAGSTGYSPSSTNKYVSAPLIDTYTANAAGYLTGGTDAQTTYGTWAAVSDGSFRVAVDGAAAVNVDGINFTGDASMAEVAATIQVKIRAATSGTETVAWSQTEDIDYDNLTEKDDLEFATEAVTYNSLVKIDDTHFIVAYYDDAKGFISTFSITAAGVITEEDSLEHDANQGTYNSLVKIDDTHFMLAYAGDGVDGYVKTFSIDGSYTITEIDELEHDTGQGTHNSLVKIDSTHFALAYCGTDNDGFIKIFTLSAAFGISQTSSLEHDAADGFYNSLVLIDSTHLMLAYQTTSNYGKLKTFSIDGSYTVAEIDSLSVGASIYYMSLVKIAVTAGDLSYFALAYKGAGDDGFLATFSIDSAWDNITLVETLEFDTADANYNSLVLLDSTHLMCAYRGEGNDGFIKIFSVGVDGTSITNTFTLEQDTTGGSHNSLATLTDTRVALTYEGADGDGFAKTFDLDFTITSGNFTITSATSGADSAISVLSTSTGTEGTDISGAGAADWMDADTGNGVATQGTSGEGKIPKFNSAGRLGGAWAPTTPSDDNDIASKTYVDDSVITYPIGLNNAGTWWTYTIPFNDQTEVENDAPWYISSNTEVYGGNIYTSTAAAYAYTNLMTMDATVYRAKFNQTEKIIVEYPLAHEGNTGDTGAFTWHGLIHDADMPGALATTDTRVGFTYDCDTGKMYTTVADGSDVTQFEITPWTTSQSQTIQIYRIEWDGAGGTCRFYVNNVLVNTETVYTPAAAEYIYLLFRQEADNKMVIGIPKVSHELPTP